MNGVRLRSVGAMVMTKDCLRIRWNSYASINLSTTSHTKTDLLSEPCPTQQLLPAKWIFIKSINLCIDKPLHCLMNLPHTQRYFN